MRRQSIIEAVIDKQKELLKTLAKSVSQYKVASDIDEDDTIDPEDFSHQTEAKEMQLRLEEHLKEEEIKLSKLEKSIDNEKLLRIIISDKTILLLGISIPKFEIDSKICIGISETAPIFQKINSLTIGDEFRILQSDEKVLSIL